MYSKLKSEKCGGETSIGKGSWMYVGENVAILDNVSREGLLRRELPIEHLRM